MQVWTPDRTVGAELQVRKRISEQGCEELRGTTEEQKRRAECTKKEGYFYGVISSKSEKECNRSSIIYVQPYLP
jgi:hypothetical protein